MRVVDRCSERVRVIGRCSERVLAVHGTRKDEWPGRGKERRDGGEVKVAGGGGGRERRRRRGMEGGAIPSKPKTLNPKPKGKGTGCYSIEA